MGRVLGAAAWMAMFSFVATFALPWLLTIRRPHIEALCRPAAVMAVDSAGLLLANGERREFRAPVYDRKLLALVASATDHGVEITEERRTIGRIEVHHWCGNDPVGRHLARVDLDELADYFESAAPIRCGGCGWRALAPQLGRYGWDSGQWREFEEWRKSAPTRSLTAPR